MPASPKQAVIIVNPVSGPGRSGHTRAKTIEKIAHDLGWTGELLETTPELHAGIMAKKAIAAGHHHLVICGGDGSVMEALEAVANHPHVTLGIVPLGTGNVFAVNLQLPWTIRQALEVALFGQVKPIDIGTANGNYFGILVGIGWDAAMVRDAKRELKDQLGLLAYFLAALRNLEHPISHYEIRIDGSAPLTVAAKSIIVANMGMIPGRIEAIPKARPDSGELTIAIVQTESVFSWLALSVSALTGHLVDDPRLQLLSGKHVEIRSLDGEQLIEADGDNIPSSDQLIVDVVAGGVSIHLP